MNPGFQVTVQIFIWIHSRGIRGEKEDFTVLRITFDGELLFDALGAVDS